MKQNTLPDLLSRADAPPPPPQSTSFDLAAAVRSKSIRRSTTRRIGGICLAIGICATALFVAHPLHRNKAPTSPVANIAQLKAEVAILDAEARFHQNTARAIEQAAASARRSAAASRILAADSLNAIQQHRESAAEILVYQARKLALQPATKDAARRELENAARLFPDTTAGRQARSFLHENI